MIACQVLTITDEDTAALDCSDHGLVIIFLEAWTVGLNVWSKISPWNRKWYDEELGWHDWWCRAGEILDNLY